MTQQLFETVLADPPTLLGQLGDRGAIRHYPLMSNEEIKAMGPAIAKHTTEDGHCWLWVTNATLRDGYDVLEAWGYTPRSILTWAKSHLGLGMYLRNSTEHILLGTKGKAPVLFRGQGTWLFAPQQDHSHKPEEVHEIIRRVSPAPRLELFARRPYPGWSVWGNEVDSDITLEGYPVPSDAAHQGPHS